MPQANSSLARSLRALRSTPITAAIATVVLGALAMVPAARAVHAQSSRGLAGTITMSLEPPAMGGSVGITSFSGTIVIANGKARIDLTSGSGPMIDYRAGDYILVPDSARVAYVRPSSQELWNMDSPFLNPYAQLTAGAGAISSSGGTSAMERLGGGDSIGGMPTQRYRINAEYSMSAGGASFPAGVTIEATVARSGTRFVAAPLAGSQSFGVGAASQVMGRIGAHLGELAKEGVLVATRSTMWFSAGNDVSINTIVTMSITNLRETDVDAAKLAMPTGYKAGGD